MVIHNDVLNQLQFLIKTAAPPLLEVQTRPDDLPEWTPGQKLPAHVLSQQPNGRFAVLVQDHVLDMNLPRNTQPGQSLELTFVSNQPRLTFMLASQPAQQPPQNTPGGANLSETAKFLGGLLQKLAQGQGEAAGKVAQSSPLLAGAPTDTKALAASLKNALSQSGLFYESHQAQWVSGERSLASLLQEPQGQLSRLLQQQATPQDAPATARSPLAQALPESSPSAPPRPDAARAQVPAAGGLPDKVAAQSEPVHPQAQNIVQQQLTAIDARQVAWQGQVWPGQVMEWQVDERDARNTEAGSDESRWQTHLHLSLPVLGDVSAVIALQAQGVQIQFRVAQQDTADLMQREQPKLRAGLESRGVSMLAMTVDRQDGKET